MAEPTSAAAAARRVRAFLDARTAYRQSLGAPRVAYLTDEIARQVTDATPSTAYTWFGDVRTLSESDLIALLDEREQLHADLAKLPQQQGTPRTQYGVRYPDHEHVSVAPDEACARVWVQQYAEVLRNVDPRFAGARVQRRTVTRSATDWEDADDSAGEEGGGDG